MEKQTPHADDEKTLRQLSEILLLDYNIQRALADAYHLGRIRGKVEGIQECSKVIA